MPKKFCSHDPFCPFGSPGNCGGCPAEPESEAGHPIFTTLKEMSMNFWHTWGIIFIQLEGSLAIRHLNTWCPKVRGEAGATASTFWLPGGQPPIEASKMQSLGSHHQPAGSTFNWGPGPKCDIGHPKIWEALLLKEICGRQKGRRKGNVNTKVKNNNTNKCQRRGWKSKLALRKKYLEITKPGPN